MTEFAKFIASQKKPPTPPAPKVTRVSRQKRKKLNRDAEYLAMRDIYLEENPACVRCGKPANQIHHIVGGTAGRARSLLNSDTWLGVCSIECHEKVDGNPLQQQIALKKCAVGNTIERLKR